MPDAKEHFGYCNCDACRVKRLERTEVRLLDELKTVRQQLAAAQERIAALEAELKAEREKRQEIYAAYKGQINVNSNLRAALRSKDERETADPAGPIRRPGDGGPGD